MRLSVALLAAVLGLPVNVEAMQFSSFNPEPGVVVITATGPIIEGDSERFIATIKALSSSARIGAFMLDSPGGNVFEAEKLASMIHNSGSPVLLAQGSECASACFLLFAAGTHRFAFDDALVGVHSVSEGSSETSASMALTTALARDAAEYGVPPGIIGKLVQTRPGRVEWLTPDDLRSMDVTLMRPPPAPAAPLPQPTTTPAAPSVPVPIPPPTTQSQPSPAYLQGLADRRSYEGWFNGLQGQYQAGAFYWSGQRSLGSPGTCYTNSAEFQAGCLAAQKSLAPTDIRRRAERDYRAGWNSF